MKDERVESRAGEMFSYLSRCINEWLPVEMKRLELHQPGPSLLFPTRFHHLITRFVDRYYTCEKLDERESWSRFDNEQKLHWKDSMLFNAEVCGVLGQLSIFFFLLAIVLKLLIFNSEIFRVGLIGYISSANGENCF